MNRVEIKNWSKDKIKNNLLNIWKGILQAFVIVIFLSFLSILIDSLLGEENYISKVFAVITEIISMPVSIGLIAYFVNFVKNNSFNKNLIYDYFPDLIKIAATMILMSIIIFIGTIFFIIPGIYLALSYSLVPYLLIDRKDLSMTETLKLSRKMMINHKLDYLVLMISFFGWCLLIPFTFGIIIIWLYPYMIISNTKFLVDVMDNYIEE